MALKANLCGVFKATSPDTRACAGGKAQIYVRHRTSRLLFTGEHAMRNCLALPRRSLGLVRF